MIYTDIFFQLWAQMGRCQMQQNEAEKARVTMERALQANKSKDHISIVQKFARLEFELGDVEKGKTIFEQTIKVSFPHSVPLEKDQFLELTLL